MQASELLHRYTRRGSALYSGFRGLVCLLIIDLSGYLFVSRAMTMPASNVVRNNDAEG